MSDKAGWFDNILGRASAKPLPTSGKRCPNGHPMALDWRECPYCKAADTASARTRQSQLDPGTVTSAGTAQRDAGAATASRRETRVGTDTPAGTSVAAPGPAPSARRHTSVLDPDDTKAQTSQRPSGGRRLTGVVFTFSWSPLGQLFEVRDGRNFVGSGTVASEGQRPCDVRLTEDDKLSGEHFLILCQGAKYRIRDCDSTNGTFVNGEQINNIGIDLEDGALIQAGATLFVFHKVRPPEPPTSSVHDDGDLDADAEARTTLRRGPGEDVSI